MRGLRFKVCITVLVCFSILLLPTCRLVVNAANRLQNVGEKLVIVIDPGHGGENLGTIDGETEEKTMTLVTAMAMYEELLKYEDIQVFMTRMDDKDLSLKERAEFAKKLGADFLFSIHYNASECNELYGSEVWVSSFAPYNAFGYQFGYELLTGMREMGLFNRGVKTRLGNKGMDYYGIIRESVALEIPAVIIEHCHVDEPHDIPFCDSEEEWKAFGVADAIAVAKYFGLKNVHENVDYSDYELVKSDAAEIVPETKFDNTWPEVCHIDLISADFDACTLKLSVTASDSDSPMMTYQYSLDGGNTFSTREPWPGCNTLTGKYQNNFTLTLEIPSGTKPSVLVRAYNMYDLHTDSNVYESHHEFRIPDVTNDSYDEQQGTLSDVTDDLKIDNYDEVSADSLEKTVLTPWELTKLILVAAIIILSMIVICQLVVYRSVRMFKRNHPK